MIEALKHGFVWLISPAAVLWIAGYAVYRRELLLGALASAATLLTVAAVAMVLFDGHLLFYQLIYTALGAVPALLALATVCTWLAYAWRKVSQALRKKALPDVL